jgi:hypothetical protein
MEEKIKCYTSHQISVQFQRRRFLEIDQSKTRIACGGTLHIIFHPEKIL